MLLDEPVDDDTAVVSCWMLFGCLLREEEEDFCFVLLLSLRSDIVLRDRFRVLVADDNDNDNNGELIWMCHPYIALL